MLLDTQVPKGFELASIRHHAALEALPGTKVFVLSERSEAKRATAITGRERCLLAFFGRSYDSHVQIFSERTMLSCQAASAKHHIA